MGSTITLILQILHGSLAPRYWKDVSCRLVTLNQVARFDTKAIHEIRVRRIARELFIGAVPHAEAG
jgi:hypothetical protein